MGTWSVIVPAIANDISSDLTSIKGNFEVLATAWSGDHVALTGNGSTSVYHDKVSLVAQAAPGQGSSEGRVYCDSGNGYDLHYAYPTDEGTNTTVRLTRGGSAVGGAYAYGTQRYSSAFSNQLCNSKNITSITGLNTAALTKSIVVTFTSTSVGSITAMTNANPCNVTVADHGLTTGDKVIISGITTPTALATAFNGNEFTITKVDDDNFTIGVANASGAWTAGGEVGLAYTVIANAEADPSHGSNAYMAIYGSQSKTVSTVTITYFMNKVGATGSVTRESNQISKFDVVIF